MPVHFAKFLFSILLVFVAICSDAQTLNESKRNWDNQIYMGNKITAGKNDWRFSGELQICLDENMQSLDNWFLEGVATYNTSLNYKLNNSISFKPSVL